MKPSGAADFAAIARRLDTMGAQLSALRAMKGTEIPALNYGAKPTQLRDHLVRLQLELGELFDQVKYNPRELGGLIPDIAGHLDTIEKLVADRYPAVTPIGPEAIEALAARFNQPIVPQPGADGR